MAAGQHACLCPEGEVDIDGRCTGKTLLPAPCSPNPCVYPNRGICSLDASVVVCSCNPGYKEVADGGCGFDACGVVSGSGPEEPDDCPSQARTVASVSDGGQSVTGGFNPARDVDWLRFAVAENHIYELWLTSSVNAPLQLVVVEEDAFTAVVDPRATFHQSHRVRFVATQARHLLARITVGDGTSTGSYSLLLIDHGTDDHGDTPTSATAAGVGTAVTGIHDHVDDVDMLSYALPANHRYQVTGSRTVLLDPSGKVVFDNRFTNPSRPTFHTATAGTYVAKFVPSWAGDVGNGFQLKIEDLGVDEPGENAASAPLVSLPLVQSGTLLPAVNGNSDVDTFAFDTVAGNSYQVLCEADAGVACQIAFITSTDAPASTTGYGSNGFISSSGARAYVMLYAYHASLVPYLVRISDVGVDLYPEAISAAPLVTADGVPHRTRNDTWSDRDAIRFSPTAGRVYRFSCLSLISTPCSAVIRDTYGNPIATTSGAAPSASFKPTAATSTVGIVMGLDNRVGDYDWILADEGPEQAGTDDAASAPLVDVGGAVNASSDFEGDVDHFAFVLDAGTSYAVTVDAGSAADGGAMLSPTVAWMDRGGIVYRSASAPGLAFSPAASGTYVLRMSAAQLGPYAFHVVTVP